MPTKKKDAKKKDVGDDGDAQLLAVKAFQKGLTAAYAAHGVEALNLQLDMGEAGDSGFLRLAVHPALGAATANCSPLQVRRAPRPPPLPPHAAARAAATLDCPRDRFRRERPP